MLFYTHATFVSTHLLGLCSHTTLLIAAVYMSGSATHVTQKTLGEKKNRLWDVGRNRSSWGICRQLFSPHFSPLSWYYIFPLYSLPFPRPYDDDSSSLLMYCSKSSLTHTSGQRRCKITERLQRRFFFIRQSSKLTKVLPENIQFTFDFLSSIF